MDDSAKRVVSPMIGLASEIRDRLTAVGDPTRAAGAKRYLKSELTFFGVRAAVLRDTVKTALRSTPALASEQRTELVEMLWATRIFELKAAAVEVLVADLRRLEPNDLALVERMLHGAGTWALVDGLAAWVAGDLVARFPHLAATLDRWAVDEDFWVRRSALLALLVPLRRGGGDFDRFARYADTMLSEREFFIRKAIGWVLREVSKKRPELVEAFLAPRLARASGLTVREATRRLPASRRDRILASFRAATSKTGSRSLPKGLSRGL